MSSKVNVNIYDSPISFAERLLLKSSLAAQNLVTEICLYPSILSRIMRGGDIYL